MMVAPSDLLPVSLSTEDIMEWTQRWPISRSLELWAYVDPHFREEPDMDEAAAEVVRGWILGLVDVPAQSEVA
jgi:hypothetical protein